MLSVVVWYFQLSVAPGHWHLQRHHRQQQVSRRIKNNDIRAWGQYFPQWFNTVGWVTGHASGLQQTCFIVHDVTPEQTKTVCEAVSDAMIHHIVSNIAVLMEHCMVSVSWHFIVKFIWYTVLLLPEVWLATGHTGHCWQRQQKETGTVQLASFYTADLAAALTTQQADTLTPASSQTTRVPYNGSICSYMQSVYAATAVVTPH